MRYIIDGNQRAEVSVSTFRNALHLCITAALLISVLSAKTAWGEEDRWVPECVKSFEKKVEGLKYLPSGLVDPTPEVIPLDYLPRDRCGFVDWAAAIKQGVIAPKDSIGGERAAAVEELPGGILIQAKMPFMPDVIFPHEPHSRWLDCGNCHTGIFEKKAGATPVSMVENWEGEYCGRCHGRVSFPLANCYRCHSKSIKPALKK